MVALKARAALHIWRSIKLILRERKTEKEVSVSS